MMIAGVAFAVVVLIMLVVGALAGWLAGLIMGQRHRGFWNNAGLGILGSIVGSLVFSLLGVFSVGLMGAIIKAVVGAVVVLAIAHGLGRRRGRP
jgi:uncharacterized membrane protein YeaQ/YmgE (transglycosylase-associated protein family)